MSAFQLAGVLLTIVSFASYLNNRFVKLPDTLGVMALGMLFSLGIMGYGHYNPASMADARELIQALNFSDLVFHGLLSFLLFAGAFHVDVSGLKSQKMPVLLLSTLGVILSTAIVGVCLQFFLYLLGINVSLLWCLVFGALISPTDPVAVLGALKNSKMPDEIKNKISGEALLNDASAVVAYATLVGLAAGTAADVSVQGISIKLAQEVFGAIGLGGLLGFSVLWLISQVKSGPINILMTLALATAGYSLCEYLHVSAPLGVVIMGLVIGSSGFGHISIAHAKQSLSTVWEAIDELLNLLLFCMIGLLVLAITFQKMYLLAGLGSVFIVLLARYVSVGLPLGAIKSTTVSRPLQAKILTWGGLRGGISIALVLSLPPFEGRELIQAITYVVVAFSILVQATTIGNLVRRWTGADAPNKANS